MSNKACCHIASYNSCPSDCYASIKHLRMDLFFLFITTVNRREKPGRKASLQVHRGVCPSQPQDGRPVDRHRPSDPSPQGPSKRHRPGTARQRRESCHRRSRTWHRLRLPPAGCPSRHPKGLQAPTRGVNVLWQPMHTVRNWEWVNA